MSETRWIITRDGRPTYGRYDTESAAFGELLHRVPYSTDHAIRYEGYAIVEVPADQWSDAEAAELRKTAQRVLADHGHPLGDRDPLTRENCGACALQGYGAFQRREEGRSFAVVNYAGWERVYTQAGKPVGPRFRKAYRFALENDDDNPGYRAALLLDVTTFGTALPEETDQ